MSAFRIRVQVLNRASIAWGGCILFIGLREGGCCVLTSVMDGFQSCIQLLLFIGLWKVVCI